MDPTPDSGPAREPELAQEDRDVRWGFFGPMRSAFFDAPTPMIEFKPGMSSVDLARRARAEVASGSVSGQPALPIRRLSERATLPAYQTPGAAGLDLAACLPEGETVRVAPGRIAVVPTGLALAIPAGFEGQVRPRSGLATKHGVTVANAPGTIDSDYRGELKVALINLGAAEFMVEHGMRIAQLVIAPVAQAVVVEADALDDTARGSGGFGSTGTR